VKSRYTVIHREGELSGNILAVFEDVSGEHELAEQVSRSEAEIAQVLAIAENPALYREFLSLVRETVRGIAETGIDFISVGALTHSARAVDIALDFIL
jgi:nicotinate-nucleotide pyrophosphorylase (carboxylating)